MGRREYHLDNSSASESCGQEISECQEWMQRSGRSAGIGRGAALKALIGRFTRWFNLVQLGP